MTMNPLIQARVEPAVMERAARVLEGVGLTISDAVRILLTPTANEGALPFAFEPTPSAHDAWFRAEVQAALDDPRPGIPHEDVEKHFAERRASALAKVDA